MPTYKAPVNDTLFLLSDVFDYAGSAICRGFSDAPLDLIEAVLAEGAEVLRRGAAAAEPRGDHEGCTRHPDGSVTTPEGFKEAYRRWSRAAGRPCGRHGLWRPGAAALPRWCCSANMSSPPTWRSPCTRA